MSSEYENKLVIIDGNSLVHRAFYAIPLLSNSRGEHTNAVYGFTNMLLKLLDEEEPAYVAVAFDPPTPSFRQKIYEEYKAQRLKTPAELGEQMQRCREILNAMRIPIFEVEGFEADDMIATLAAAAEDRGLETLVVTGDGDLLQLVGDTVTVLLTRKGITNMERCDPASLKENFGFEPAQVIDYKALKGDPSDNIPGVPGIGDKTARRLLERYGSLEMIFEEIETLDQKLRQKLEENRSDLFTGRELITLRRDVPLSFDWEQCRRSDPDYPALLEIFNALEFKGLASRVEQKLPAEEIKHEAAALQGELIDSAEKLDHILESIPAGDSVALLIDIPAARPYWRHSPLLAALALSGGKAYYLLPERLGAHASALWLCLSRAWDRGVTVIGHDSKYIYNYLSEEKLPPPPFVFDTHLAAYLLEPTRSSYDLGQLLYDYLALTGLTPGSGRRGKQDEQLAPEQRGGLLASCAASLFSLREKLDALLEAGELRALYYELELLLAGVLARMEKQGMAVDLTLLGELSDEIRSRLEEVENDIYRLAGERFNLNSPQQLAAVLFEKLGLPVVRKTKTGRSTDAKVLEELAPRHEIVARILYYRQLVKLEGTYLSGLLPLVDRGDRKIYTMLNQTVTATGRLSSSEPNLQNIPVRLEEGRRIRRAFVPSEEGSVLLTADYSQIELRILAHLSGDPILRESFVNDEDIHRRTAAEVFHVAPEEVTSTMRSRAKAVNFGIIYGISDYGLARGLGVSRVEAQRYIESYFERYEGVRRYVNAVIAEARECGYVKTLFKRRRYLPELRSPHFGRRSFAERIARNTPIQGTAADIIKLAMLRIDRIINEGGFEAKMLLQIHDELLFEVEKGALAFFAPVVRREMEEAFSLSVPLKVDLMAGPSWYELSPLDKSSS